MDTEAKINPTSHSTYIEAGKKFSWLLLFIPFIIVEIKNNQEKINNLQLGNNISQFLKILDLNNFNLSVTPSECALVLLIFRHFLLISIPTP